MKKSSNFKKTISVGAGFLALSVIHNEVNWKRSMIADNIEIGRVYNYLEKVMNPSTAELSELLKPRCISFEESKEDEFDIIRFLMKKNIWGPVEHITIMSDDDFPVSYGIHSKERKEYNQVVNIVQSGNFHKVLTHGHTIYFAEPESYFVIGLAKDVQQQGDTLQTIMPKTMLDLELP